MARLPRLTVPGYPHHVIQRGNNRQMIFRDAADHEFMLGLLTEQADYERDTLYPLATEQLQIDLDDGVKVNYLKFGAALKKIVGLDAKGED